MKSHNLELIVRIGIIVLISVVTGVGLALGWYWLVLILLPIAGILIHQLLRFQNRTVDELKRFVSSIRHDEFSISFQYALKNGLDKEIGQKLDEVVTILGEKTQAKEAKLNFYDILLSRIDFALLVIDPHDKIVWINRVAMQIIGRLTYLSELNDRLPEVYTTISQLKPGMVKTVKLSNDQQEAGLAVSVVHAVIRNEQIRIISLKNIQSVLNETESEAWKKLVRILRHEIMNSMAPIISLAETFSDKKIIYDSDLIHQSMQTIYRRSKGLVEFVQNYKQLADIPTPHIVAFQVSEMLEGLTNLLKAQDICFSYEVNPADLVIKADRTQIEQVLLNLIKNAREAIPSGVQQQPVIHITAETDRFQRPIISVADNGIGILPDVQERIFIPFFTTKKQGSGIGLSICRQIIHAHGGCLSVQSVPDQGACFTIRL